MAIIKSSNDKEKIINSLYSKKELRLTNVNDQSTKGITLEYFTIINKIINHYTKHNNESTKEEKKSTIMITEPISSTLRGLDLNFKSEHYKEKSFFEKVSFFLTTTRNVVRATSIDTSIEFINTYKENLNKLNELSKEADELKKKLAGKQTAYIYDTKEINIDEAYENELYKLFTQYPEYKQAKDEFDRLKSEKTQKIEQMNNLVLELNNFRQYILDEFNPIVLELLDLLEENELNFKKEYMEISEKLYQKINYSFKSTSLKEIIKSEKLLKWDELKNCIEILEKDNILLDNEIDKIIGNKFFKNYINNELKDFNTVKSKLNSLIKQNEIIITKLPKIVKDIELEKLKKELKSLESKLQELVEQKTEYLNDIEEFNREYNLHLGDLIKDILNLKKEILYKKTIKQQKKKEKYQEDIKTFEDTKETIVELKSTISELEDTLDSIDENDENYKELSEAYNELKEELEKLEDELELQEEELEKTKEFIEDDTIEQEYEEVKSHYEEFENEYKHTKESFKNSIQLNEDEKKELKLLYKKAARLCHPDIVPDELKEKAHNLIQKLNEAYSQKDISKVKEILHSLQNGTSFEVSSETIEDKELLKIKIKEYLKNIEAIKTEIEELKEDVAYQTIVELDDWDEYFKNLKDELEVEKKRLEEESLEVLEEKELLEATKSIKSQPLKKEKSQNEEEDYWNEIF